MSRPNRNESIEKKIAIILAMPEKPKPVSIAKMIQVLDRFEKRINVAMFLSKN